MSAVSASPASEPSFADLRELSAEQLTKIALDHPKFAVRHRAILAVYSSGLREGVRIATAAQDASLERTAVAQKAMVPSFATTPLQGVSVTRVPVGAQS